MKQVIIPREIVTVNNDNQIIRNHAIVLNDSVIEDIIPVSKLEENSAYEKIYHFDELTLLPGFVQTHFHLCQTLFRGLADDLLLLDWLQQRIFPYENAHDYQSLSASAKLGIAGLQKSGTTTVLDMGTLRNQEAVFDELIYSGMRGFSGKCMIDQNELLKEFKENTDIELKNTFELAKEYHNSNSGKIKYGFAPRFVLSCSEQLLKETKLMMKDFYGSLYHSHSSENIEEVNIVRQMTGKGNIEYFDSIDILDDYTVMAHCIHVSDEETELIRNSGMRVSHCPSANLKLGSGIAPVPKYLTEEISVSIGADGPPCNNHLDMFNEMRLASLIQKPIHGPTSMPAPTILRMATIEGAKALHLENEIGSIEVGKKADFTLLDLNEINQSVLTNDEQIISNIVYSAGESNVKNVFIDGKLVVDNSVSTNYDEEKILDDARLELKKLLKRV